MDDKRQESAKSTPRCALYTAPVASYQPNAFGLSDMTGNVTEWVQDCGADSDEVITWDCRARLIRGGAWDGFPVDLRSADPGPPDGPLRKGSGYFGWIRS